MAFLIGQWMLSYRLLLNPMILYDIQAKLASDLEHQRFGLNYPQWMPKLTFNAIETSQGGSLKITSRQPIKEPLVNFVIQINYKELTLFKEITLFLDPVLISARQNDDLAESNPSLSSAAAKMPTRVGSKTSDRANTRKTITSTVAIHTNQVNEFRVARGMNLWKIANDWHLPGATMQQKMDAIFLNNQHAFINGNKNLLKQGSVIKFSANNIQLNENQMATQSSPSLATQKPTESVKTIESNQISQLSIHSANDFNKRLQIEKELIQLNQVIAQQQALNSALKQQLNNLEKQIILQNKVKTLQNMAEQKLTDPKESSDKSISYSSSQNFEQAPASIDGIVEQSIPVEADNNLESNLSGQSLLNSNSQELTGKDTFASPRSTWFTALWFTIALLLAYLGTLFARKYKAQKFAQGLNNRLQSIAYNSQREQSQTPSIKELSIPKNLSTSVQIKYLNSAADFYMRCHRHDLAKELVNEGLIEFSGNPQIIATLNEIRKNIYSHQDSELQSHISKKLSDRELAEENDELNEEEFLDEDKINIEDFNEHWLKRWGKKVS